ncbi:response regulator transcription factor [Melghirimyces algeriensis]|uniref:Two-component system, OmpR family, response regulator YxdJ n=1 Tax=Melghirimyces algeriensis TaxID=910412 RepID=A0A521ENL9_9BACL|nr:response regulator transcription factor [Melghirimyces algeriensis]SMO85492.1 two-component system, OmpR family, response regulator YxdJ [Melghirimyces algeriensis]
MHQIMIVEDDPKIAMLLEQYIAKYGYQTARTEDFSQVLEDFKRWHPDLVLLDVNLPKFDGFYWCRQIRLISHCPILFISARGSKMDQVMALENGADDYIPKPFDADIVIAKIRSQLRRAYGSYAPKMEERILTYQDLTLYPERMELVRHDQSVDLTKKEALLMEALLKRPMRVVNRGQLLEKLWDDQDFVDDNTLNVYVARVRKKLNELGLNGVLETVRGAGYRLRLEEEEE